MEGGVSVTDTNYLAGATITSGNVTRVESAPGETINNGNAGSGVTGTESFRARLIKTRNDRRIWRELLAAGRREAAADLAKAKDAVGGAADFCALLVELGKYDVPEEEEAWAKARLARKTAEVCGQCYRPLGPAETVYVDSDVYVGIARLVGRPRYERTSKCEECAPAYMREPDAWRPRFRKSPCNWCERSVVYKASSRDYYDRHVFCCARCQWTRYNGARNERNARAREKVCEVCERPFTAARRDAKTCSPACKQKAYRRRKGAES